MCVNCRSGGHRVKAQEAFLFHHCCSSSWVPTALCIPKHLTHHRACSIVPWLTMAPTKMQKHTHNRITTTQTFMDFGKKTSFFVVTYSYISSLHSIQCQTSRKSVSSPQQQGTEAFGVFLYGYIWVVRVSVHLLLVRVKSTTLGVIH